MGTQNYRRPWSTPAEFKAELDKIRDGLDELFIYLEFVARGHIEKKITGDVSICIDDGSWKVIREARKTLKDGLQNAAVVVYVDRQKPHAESFQVEALPDNVVPFHS